VANEWVANYLFSTIHHFRVEALTAPYICSFFSERADGARLQECLSMAGASLQDWHSSHNLPLPVPVRHPPFSQCCRPALHLSETGTDDSSSGHCSSWALTGHFHEIQLGYFIVVSIGHSGERLIFYVVHSFLFWHSGERLIITVAKTYTAFVCSTGLLSCQWVVAPAAPFISKQARLLRGLD
jgi:hypothetical protein